MATIIQPYNAWREQLAANFLAPIVGNILQRSQEANQNRKMNALMGKVNEDITALGSKNQGQQNLLTGEPMPEGYNNDGWAKAFHTSYTPITQYDLGTNLLTGQPVKPYTPTVQDYMNAINSNLATPRFGMLNRDNVMKAFEPIMKASEAARIEQLRKGTADAYANASTPQEQFNALMRGNIEGLIDTSSLTAHQRNYEYANPHKLPSNVNIGGQTVYNSFDPASGTFTEQGRVDNTMSPNQIAQLQLGYDQMGLQREELQDNRAYRRGILQNQENTFALELVKQQAKILDDNEKSILAMLQQANEEWDTLDDKKKTPEATTAQQNKILALQGQLQDIQARRASLLNSYPSYGQGTPHSGQDDLAVFFSDNSGYNGRITGHYGEDRRDHKHAGVDIAMNGGTNIAIPSHWGNNFTIVETNSKPAVKGKGYGNYAIIEGERNGQRVRYRLAHLQNPVTKRGQVNTGDIIGQVGSTGRSTGNHLHLEVIVQDKNGKWITTDPKKFFSQPVNQQYAPSVTPIGSQQTAQTTQAQATPPKDNSVMFINNPQDKKITASEYQALKQSYRNSKEYKDLSDQELEQKILEDLKNEGYISRGEDLRPSYMRGFGNQQQIASPYINVITPNSQIKYTGTDTNVIPSLGSNAFDNIPFLDNENSLLTLPERSEVKNSGLTRDTPLANKKIFNFSESPTREVSSADTPVNENDNRFAPLFTGNVASILKPYAENALEAFNKAVNTSPKPFPERPTERPGNNQSYITDVIENGIRNAGDLYAQSKNAVQEFMPTINEFAPQGLPSSRRLHDRAQEGEDYPEYPVAADNPPVSSDMSTGNDYYEANQRALKDIQLMRNVLTDAPLTYYWDPERTYKEYLYRPYSNGSFNDSVKSPLTGAGNIFENGGYLEFPTISGDATPPYMRGNINLPSYSPVVNILNEKEYIPPPTSNGISWIDTNNFPDVDYLPYNRLDVPVPGNILNNNSDNWIDELLDMGLLTSEDINEIMERNRRISDPYSLEYWEYTSSPDNFIKNEREYWRKKIERNRVNRKRNN